MFDLGGVAVVSQEPVHLGPFRAASEAPPQAIAPQRKQLVLIPLWKEPMEAARTAAAARANECQFVFAQLAKESALQGSLLLDLAREGVRVVYVPNHFSERSAQDPELRDFVLQVLRTQDEARFDNAMGDRIAVDAHAAAKMRDRVRSQSAPSPSAFSELVREFYEFNAFEVPGRPK
ncbi:MAG: hypothetical protein KIS62_00430 [Ramlibacter sp.]|nr:hypothetical protein [Ramlibacter sp.]MCW5648189.1 hypothetical protein [Ramlibacter sp.]